MIAIFYTQIPNEINKDFIINSINQLPDFIKSRILLYKDEKDRLLRICSKLLLKHLLDYYCHTPKLSLQDLKYTNLNKPYFDADFDFSITHSGNLVIVAGIKTGKIGIDCEQKKNALNFEVLSEFLTKDETKLIDISDDKVSVFYDLWVKKEAFIKATGEGIMLTLFEVDAIKDIIRYKKMMFYLDKILINNNYSTWLATDKFPIQYKSINISFEKLIFQKK